MGPKVVIHGLALRQLLSPRSFPRPHIFDAERGGEVRIIRHSKPLRHCFAVENQK